MLIVINMSAQSFLFSFSSKPLICLDPVKAEPSKRASPIDKAVKEAKKETVKEQAVKKETVKEQAVKKEKEEMAPPVLVKSAEVAVGYLCQLEYQQLIKVRVDAPLLNIWQDNPVIFLGGIRSGHTRGVP